MSWFGFDLTFYFAVSTLILNSFLGFIWKTIRCRKLILDRVIGWGVGRQCHGLVR